MSIILFILLLLVSTTFLMGIINPKNVRELNIHSRKQVLVYLGMATLIAFVLFGISAGHSGNTSEKEKISETKPSQTTKLNPELESTETSLHEENWSNKIHIGFLAVKEINGKFRYFFNYQNSSDKDFVGMIKIVLLSRNGNELTIEEIPGTIRAKGAGHQYWDMNTGVPSMHGDYGISSYRYEIWKDNEIVSSGKGQIPDWITE